MPGIQGYAVHVPTYRLDRAQIGATLGLRAGRGVRPVASHDEDTTTLAVAAARAAVARAGGEVDALWFATSRPAYLEKSNATTVAVASGLPAGAGAYDVGGALRSGAGALRAALTVPGHVAVLSDVRFGMPGSADEASGADAAAAFVSGDSPVAELVATASVTSEFLDRWREPGQVRTRTWEERFGVEEYVPVATEVVQQVLAAAGVELADVQHVALSAPHARALATVRRAFTPEQLALGGFAGIGHAGAADPGIQLAAALDASAPGDRVLVVSLVDGADAFLLRATDRIAEHPSSGVADALATGTPVSYGDYLLWRGLLPREPARRPDVKPPVPPASRRTAAWKFRFEAAECGDCGYRNMPPRQVCLKCSSQGPFTGVAMADVPARIATFSTDWLSESVQLPATAVAIDFEGGGRFEFEMADAVGYEAEIGHRVEPTFRVASVAANGVRNYIWKVRPASSAPAQEEN